MNTDTVCIFPDTTPKAELLFPLVQVFEPVVYLRPVENDPPAAGELSPLCREMIARNLVRFHCPAPLLEQRDRFLNLVHDLQHRRDDYALQLSHLSLASLGSSRETDSKTSVITSLLRQSGIREEQDKQRTMVLWQARLLLKLGEMFDHEQQELREKLARISAREKELIADLREDSEQPFSLGRIARTDNGDTGGQLRLRLKAWSRLFALASDPVVSSLFITTNRDALDLLTEQYESGHDTFPRKILNLELPGGRMSDTFSEQRAAFRKEAAGLITALHRLPAEPESAGEQDWSSLNNEDGSWAALLERHYPAAEHSRCTLSLFSLPSVDPGVLFLETFARGTNEVQTAAGESKRSGIIIGLLEEQTGNNYRQP